jgi:IS5 family transposase
MPHLFEGHALSPKILQVSNIRLAAYGLLRKTGTVVDATLNAAPSSTKNETGGSDPEMHQVKKDALRHGDQQSVFADAGY